MTSLSKDSFADLLVRAHVCAYMRMHPPILECKYYVGERTFSAQACGRSLSAMIFWCAFMWLLCMLVYTKNPSLTHLLALHPYFINLRACNCIADELGLLKSLWRLFI